MDTDRFNGEIYNFVNEKNISKSVIYQTKHTNQTLIISALLAHDRWTHNIV